MAPVIFKDVSKKAKDLLDKDFVTNHEFEIKNSTTNGIDFKTNGKRNGTGFNLDFEVEYTDKPAGLKVKEKLNQAGELTLDVELSNKLVDGLKVNVESVTSSGAPKAIKATGQFANKQTATVVSVDLQKYTVEASSVLAYENFLVGARTTFDTAKGGINGADAVASYAAKDTTVTAGLNASEEVVASFVHNLSAADATLVGSASYNLNSKASKFTVGGVYKSGPDSSLKGKIDQAGALSLLYSQKVNANLTLGLGTQISTSKLGGPDSQQVGVSFKYSS